MFSNVRSGEWKFWVRPMKFLLHFNLHNLKSDYILHKNTSGNRSNNVIWAQAHWVVWNGYLYARHLQTSKVGNPIMQLPPLVSYFFYGYKYGITFQNFMPNKPRVSKKRKQCAISVTVIFSGPPCHLSSDFGWSSIPSSHSWRNLSTEGS